MNVLEHALDVLIAVCFAVAFVAGLVAAWTYDSRPVLENSGTGTAARSADGGEARSAACCALYDQDAVAA